MDVAAFADLLRETADRHGAFEAVAPPHDWWDWYAAHLSARQGGAPPDEAFATAGRYMLWSSTSSSYPSDPAGDDSS